MNSLGYPEGTIGGREGGLERGSSWRGRGGRRRGKKKGGDGRIGTRGGGEKESRGVKGVHYKDFLLLFASSSTSSSLLLRCDEDDKPRGRGTTSYVEKTIGSREGGRGGTREGVQ